MEIQKKKIENFINLRVGDSPYVKEKKSKKTKKTTTTNFSINKKQQYNYKENKIIRL